MHKKTIGPDLEWERYIYCLPKSGARVERIREIVMNDHDLDFMDLAKPN